MEYYKSTKHTHSHFPHIFAHWADLVAHLLLPKSSMAWVTDRPPNDWYLTKWLLTEYPLYDKLPNGISSTVKSPNEERRGMDILTNHSPNSI